MVKSRWSHALVYLVLIAACLLIALPFYMAIIAAFKTPLENMQSYFAFPKSLYLGNFTEVLNRQGYYQSVWNTFYITILGIAGMMVILPMASFPIARKMSTSRAYRLLYFFMLVGIFVPFQVKMMPLVKLAGSMNLMNVNGIILLYLAGSVCEGVFLYVGYIQSIPADLEEAAYIDGASTLRTYRSVILPLIKPMIATVSIKNALWLWNDFLLPLLILNKTTEDWTLTLFQYNFKTKFSSDPTLIMTSFLLSMLPVFLTYMFAQRYIIGGLVSGGVKA